MDGSLSSSRYGDGVGGGGRGGGGGHRQHHHYGGGGGRRRGGGRGYHNRRHHPYRRDDRGGGNRYGGGGGGGGRPRHSGNRFQSSQSASAKSVDPKAAMLRQLSAMISRVGDVQAPPAPEKKDDSAMVEGGDDDGEQQPDTSSTLQNSTEAQDEESRKYYMDSLSKNISDLAAVLCSESSAPLFLSYKKDSDNTNASSGDGGDVQMSDVAPSKDSSPQKLAEETAGPLVHLIISCVSSLPLQTPVYVGLTMAINTEASNTEYAGFASRCIQYAMKQISWDLDLLLSSSFSLNSSEDNTNGTSITSTSLDFAAAASRIQNILRYLALLGRLNIVQGYNESTDVEESGNPIDEQNLSIAGLLKMLTMASVKAVKLGGGSHQQHVGCILAQIVLSTILYAYEYLPEHFFVDHLLNPIEANVLSVDLYKSTFIPGKGTNALLLSKEQQDDGDDEEKGDEEEEEEEDDDSDDEDGEGNAGGRCDTLQDLLHTVKALLQDKTGQGSTKFFLLQHLAWNELLKKKDISAQEQEGAPEDATTATMKTDEEENPFIPIHLELTKDCLWVQSLVMDTSEFDSTLTYCTLDGVVFGRLPVFGTHEEDDDEEDDDDDDEEEKKPLNERLVAYQKNFTALDRQLLADSVRSCLIHHKSHVSDTGLERGSAKDAAATIWAVGKLFGAAPNIAVSPMGVEYGIVETILGLIVQAKETGALRQVYLSRVLLELSRLEPSLIPQALVTGLSTLFQDYLPSFVPSARNNIGKWFAFHLANTDYQWPPAYWNHWSSYVDKLKGTQKQRNSRGEFVLHALRTMMSTNAKINVIYDCFPNGSSLCSHLVVMPPVSAESDQDALDLVKKEIEQRIWDMNEDTDAVGEYMVSDDVTTKLANGVATDQQAIRTKLLIKAILAPAEKQKQQVIQSMEAMKAEGSGGDSMMDVSYNNEPSKDLLQVLPDAIVQYKPALMVALEFDARSLEKQDNGGDDIVTDTVGGDNDKYKISCEVSLLEQLHETLSQSNILLSSCITSLLKNQIVSTAGVLHWVLGDVGVDDNSSAIVVQGWWDLAALTLPGVAANGGLGNDIQSMLDAISPSLRYVVQRVCSLLLSSSKFGGAEVDLLEGTKEFIATAYTRLTVAARRDSSIRSSEELRLKLIDAGIDNAKLSALCRDSSSGEPQVSKTEFIELLMGILDSMMI